MQAIPHRLSLALLAGLMLAAPTGCTSTGEARDNAGEPAPIPDALDHLRGQWRVAAIRGEPIENAPDRRPPTMTITDEGRLGGFAGINRWSSTLDTGAVPGGRFAIGQTVTTLMAGPPEAMELEDDFVSALRQVTAFDPAALADGNLRLLGPDGSELLRLERAE